MYPALLLCAAGCSGINASKSVSPLDFLIPGGGGLFHMQNSPPPNVADMTNLLAAVPASDRTVLIR